MAETLNTDFTEEAESGMLSDDRKRESEPETNSNGYIALDFSSLSLLAADHGTPVKKTLSRKGSQRGGERKVPDSTVAVAAGCEGAEKLVTFVHVADDKDEGTLRLGTSITARVAVSDGRFRRLAFRRPARWLDPRRVLVFFATLSSVGTLILLYFTLFMGNIPGGDGNA